MQRLLLIAVCLTAMATAQAQKIPLYNEVYDEHTEKLVSKEWRSAEGHLRQESPRADGTWNVAIYRADSLKFYTVAEKTKTVAELPMSQLHTSMFGVENAGSSKEFLRREVVEGYDCAVYKITKYTTRTGGQTESTYHTEWYYEPLDLVIRYVESFNAMNLVHRNIRRGAQPAHLFEIPKDYKWFDTNAALNQMNSQMDILKSIGQGKAPAGSSPEKQQQVQDALKQIQDAFGGKK
jgi:hypothetical protein